MTSSAPIASSVCAVSLRDSPLLTLEPFAEKLITSAESRLAAASKLRRVLVESSKKRLTTVRPRKVGNFLIAPSVMRESSRAVSSTSRAPSRDKSFTERRWPEVITESPQLGLSNRSLEVEPERSRENWWECFCQHNLRG